MMHFLRMFLGLWLCLGLTTIFAQVSDDFEGGDLAGWYSEGDGDYSLSSAQGNPGSSLRVADDATGSINYAIAPGRYLGDWSNATAVDSLVFDVYVESNDPDTIAGSFPAVELVGPGGRATAFDGLDLPRNQWERVGLPLDSALWNVSSGTWQGLLANVNLIRLRAEYINGGENVYLDNIRLDVSPVRNAIVDTVCSTFEDGTVEGWRFEEAGAIGVDSASGNPGQGVRVADRGTVISQAIAPPKFLGDWTALTDSGQVSVDLWIDNSSGGLYDKAYLIQLSGNGAEAFIRPADSVLNLAVGQWHTYTFLIDSSAWTLASGEWDSLMVSVEEVRLELEFIAGGELARMDNFCLLPGPQSSTSVEAPAPALAWALAPNPAQGEVRLQWPRRAETIPAGRLRVLDAQGRTVLQRPTERRRATTWSVAAWAPGLYWVSFQPESGAAPLTQLLRVE